jgi:hypothetical protein
MIVGPTIITYMSTWPRREGRPLHPINQLLQPEHEIRVYSDSRGFDTLIFLPLPAADRTAFEARFGKKVAARFRKIEAHPNYLH